MTKLGRSNQATKEPKGLLNPHLATRLEKLVEDIHTAHPGIEVFIVVSMGIQLQYLSNMTDKRGVAVLLAKMLLANRDLLPVFKTAFDYFHQQSQTLVEQAVEQVEEEKL